MNFQEILSREFAPVGRLTSHQLDQLQAHCELLIRWNEKVNLIRFGSIEQAVRFHYCESLFLAQRLPSGALSILDLGSGAGFPGVPIAAARPESAITLLEAHQRKAVFLREVGRTIPNIRVLASRAETVDMRPDWVVSRAVNPRDVLSFDIADRYAILMSEKDLPGLFPVEVTKIPWGEHRVIAEFHVERANIDQRGQGHRNHEPKGRRR